MDLTAVATALEKVAPSIAGAFLGPLGASGALLVEQALGLDAGTTERDPAAVTAALATATPDQILALQKADNDFKAAQLAHESDVLRAYLGDVQSARQRDMGFLSAGRSNTRGNVMCYSAIGAFIACLGILFFAPIPAAGVAHDILMAMIGVLAGIVKDLYGFEFGSSRGSDDKTGLIASLSLTTAAALPQPPVMRALPAPAKVSRS